MFKFLTENFRPILLLLLAALLIFLYLWLSRPPAKDPVPTFQVSAGSIIVTPDKTLGADLVKIRAFNAQDSLLASGELAAPFDVPFTINFDKSVESVRCEMEYFKDGQRIGCPPFDGMIILPPIGTPIVTIDVPIGKSNTTFSADPPHWCDCAFGPSGVLQQCTTATYFQYSIGSGTASTGKYRVVVTKSTTVSPNPTSTETSRFMLSIENPAGSMNVRYYTAANMPCSGTTLTPALSSAIDFIPQAFDKAIFHNNIANTAAPKYTCQVQKLLDCVGSESDRIIVVKCDETPPPSSTTVSYTVSVTKAPALPVCGDGSTL